MLTQSPKTAELSDRHPGLQICEPLFRDYGGRKAFDGSVQTIKCFEDNSLLREELSRPGRDRVLVVDAGGSLRCAMLGDQLAELALANGWVGVLLYGCIRDSEAIARMPLGVKALAAHPLKSRKRGVGEVAVTVSFAGVQFLPGQHLYADTDGVLIAPGKVEADRVCAGFANRPP